MYQRLAIGALPSAPMPRTRAQSPMDQLVREKEKTLARITMTNTITVVIASRAASAKRSWPPPYAPAGRK